MKSVIISIQPKWCELIASGKKTIEVRRTRPKINTPFKCYIYMTKNGNHVIRQLNNGAIVDIDYKMCGKVIGEFVCDKIGKYHTVWLDGEDRLKSTTCLDDVEIMDYMDNTVDKVFYLWHISKLKIYDEPKELSEFTYPCKGYDNKCSDCIYGVRRRFDIMGELESCDRHFTRPPQSWCYCEELQ